MSETPAPADPIRASSPKRGILVFLKGRPDASLEEIARAMGISKVAALGHLQKLEAERLVQRAYRAQGVGRPRVIFRLTPESVTLFPQGYAEMSRAALEFIERKMGPGAVGELLAQRAHEVADRNRARLASGTLKERVAELARIRTEGGYMAEVAGSRRGSVELLEHNCPILALAERFPVACETERRMFESVLHADVEASHRVVAGDPVCRFLIRDGRRSP